MAKLVIMPKLGLTMTEGEVTHWYKDEGDAVTAGEALFEVATDKITNDVEATESGILRKILISENESTACLEPVAIIASADEDIRSILNQSDHEGIEVEAVSKRMESVVDTKKMESPSKQGRIKASPVAKKLAAENNVDLVLLQGTGPKGRITLEDVEKFINTSDSSKEKATPRAEKSDVISIDSLNLVNENNLALATQPTETRIPLSQMRKVISTRMSESWNVSPAVTFDIRVDMTRLIEIRNGLKEIHKISYTDLLVKIVATTLLEFPYLNSSLENNEIVTRNYANIGVAVALESGLMVPVVKYANTKGLKQISDEVKALAEKARNNELSPDQMTGGTFTISNLGMYGIESFSPIINQPEVAILGVNTITETPVVENGEVVIKPLMNISLTADHRVVDGSLAAQFLARLKQYIEKPEILLL